jgi:LuxR family transcriptional regulator, quorum-sensing system regulator CciR
MSGQVESAAGLSMTQLSDVQAFIDQSHRATSPDELHALMQGISLDMGFDYFALAHHVDLRAFGPFDDGQIVTSEFVALSNYPEAWVEEYIRGDVVNFDPRLLASQRTNVGFAWDRIHELIDITPSHRKIIERARKAGIEDGFTVPANIPGELNGSCNFAVGPRRAAPRANFPMAQLVGSFAFQAARSLVERMRGFDAARAVKLTERQLECIVLVARGKTDWEIGKILGISEETVKQHIADARARYDVPKRMQVVLRALYDGLVPLSEMLC